MSTIEKMLAAITGLMALAFIVILTLLSAKIGKLNKELEAYKNAPADTTTTVTIDSTEYKDLEKSITERYEKAMDSVELNVKYLRDIIRKLQNEKGQIDTCILHDTVLKLWKAPREYLVYKDSTYRAVVSGIDPRLDTLNIYRPIITQTITKYVKTPPPFLQAMAGGGILTQIGGENKSRIVTLDGGIEINNKVVIQGEVGRDFKANKNYGGGKVFIKF